MSGTASCTGFRGASRRGRRGRRSRRDRRAWPCGSPRRPAGWPARARRGRAARALSERHQAHRGRYEVAGEGLEIARPSRCPRRCHACRRWRRPRPDMRRGHGSRGGFQAAAAATNAVPWSSVSIRRSRDGAMAAARSAISSAARSLPGAMRVAQQDRVVAAGAVHQDVGEPGPERVAVADVAALHRPFQAVRIGVARRSEMPATATPADAAIRHRTPGFLLPVRADR